MVDDNCYFNRNTDYDNIKKAIRKLFLQCFFIYDKFTVFVDAKWNETILAASLIFLVSGWIEKRKTICFIIAVLFASTIHYTVLIMIPMYFIAVAKPFGKRVMLLNDISLISSCFS